MEKAVAMAQPCGAVEGIARVACQVYRCYIAHEL
jgi:hypothetical protein